MKHPSIHDAIADLKHYLRILEPDKDILNSISSVQDIFESRDLLKTLPGNNHTISHLCDLILQAIDNKRRLRTLDCLKVLRAMIKNTSHAPLARETTHKLFRIYKQFVFSHNEQIQWCVSVLLKDRELLDDDVTWLIENADRSKHIVNRLLLYPSPHPAIVCWAQKAYEAQILPHREAEVLALLLTPKNVEQYAETDPGVLAWAIYRSRLTTQSKLRLLKRCSCLESFHEIKDIAGRLGAVELVRSFLRKLERQVGEERTVD